jgi:pyrimidine deaminase RibD-like protein
VSIEQAIRIANSNQSYDRWPLGAVIVKGGSIQSVGWSALKTVPQHTGCSVHAEAHALRRMRNEAHGCVMYVARRLRRGGVGMARPCPDCQRLIIHSGIKRVIYTVDSSTLGVWKPRQDLPDEILDYQLQVMVA